MHLPLARLGVAGAAIETVGLIENSIDEIQRALRLWTKTTATPPYLDDSTVRQYVTAGSGSAHEVGRDCKLLQESPF